MCEGKMCGWVRGGHMGFMGVHMVWEGRSCDM